MAKNPAPRKEPRPRRPAARSRSIPAAGSSAPPAGAPAETPETPEPHADVPEERVAPVSEAAPSHDEIAHRAYEIYQARGGTHGTHLEDWIQAERELREARRPKVS